MVQCDQKLKFAGRRIELLNQRGPPLHPVTPSHPKRSIIPQSFENKMIQQSQQYPAKYPPPPLHPIKLFNAFNSLISVLKTKPRYII